MNPNDKLFKSLEDEIIIGEMIEQEKLEELLEVKEEIVEQEKLDFDEWEDEN